MHPLCAVSNEPAARSGCGGRALRACIALLLLVPLLSTPAAAGEVPDDVAAILSLVLEGRDADARAALAPLLEREPERPYVRLLHGILLAREDRGREAVAVMEDLRRDAPDIPEVWNNLAVLYGAEGRLDRARDVLLATLERWPDFAAAHENLGEVYAHLAHRSRERAGELDATGGVSPAALEMVASPSRDGSCIVAEGIGDAAAAAAAAAWLRERGATAVDVRARPRSVAHYRFYIAPLASRAAAAALAREIRGRGVGDVGVIGAGALANGVSLGVFRVAANGQRRAEALRSLGYAVERAVEWKPVDAWAIEARSGETADALRAAWTARNAAWPIEVVDCG